VNFSNKKNEKIVKKTITRISLIKALSGEENNSLFLPGGLYLTFFQKKIFF
jgi:hypothetical protein